MKGFKMRVVNDVSKNQVSFQRISGKFLREDELDATRICINIVDKYSDNPDWIINKAFNQFNQKEDVFEYHFGINSNLKAQDARIEAEKTAFKDIIAFAKQNKLIWSFERTEGSRHVHTSVGGIFD